jgi:alpha-L-fucosidase
MDEKGWFWHPGTEKIRPVEDIVNMVKLCNSRNANYLLDVPPDTSGILPMTYVNWLKAVGDKLK